MEARKATYSPSLTAFLMQRAADYFVLLKFRLTAVVVFSAVFGFLMAPEAQGGYMSLLYLALGGFLVTGAANTFNQVIEAEWDRLMSRTQHRPMARQSLSSLEGVIVALVAGVSGVLILGLQFNLTTALLGIIAILSYAFVYTPLKRMHPVAVLVGAFPGAMPPMIGWAAATGEIGWGAVALFLIQFIWQFPHFWSLAWVLDEDYSRAGFKMLPTQPGRSQVTATLVFFYAFLLIPIWVMPWQLGLLSGLPLAACVGVSVLFCLQGWNLLRKLNNKAAVQLMLGSFLYLPLVQLLMLANQYL